MLLFLDMEQQPPNYEEMDMQNIVNMLQLIVSMLETVVQRLMQLQ